MVPSPRWGLQRNSWGLYAFHIGLGSFVSIFSTVEYSMV